MKDSSENKQNKKQHKPSESDFKLITDCLKFLIDKIRDNDKIDSKEFFYSQEFVGNLVDKTLNKDKLSEFIDLSKLVI